MSERTSVAVLGLGRIGAALALALKGAKGFGQVVGWDADFDVARRAQKGAVADRFVGRAPEAVRQAGAVFVAVEPPDVRETLVAVGPHLRPGAVVCGLQADQEHTCAVAAEVLPGNVSFVAAHPLLWERPTSEAAPTATLFRRGVLCLAPLSSAHPDAVAYLTSLAGALEMEAFFLDPREHDAFASGVELLPSLLGAAYLRVTGREGSWRELGRLAGGEFRQIGALADLDPARGQAETNANREHLVRWLDDLLAELNGLRDALQEGKAPEDYFVPAHETWRAWLRTRQLPPGSAELPPPPDVPKRRFLF